MSAGRPADASIDHLPRLPRVYVPRRRLWARLDRAVEAAVTVLVGPGGAGKTLGVVGWLRETGRTEQTTWVRADPTWTPERLLPLLDRDRLVVVDDAQDLPIATIRALDARLDTEPDSLRLLMVSRWDLPFTRLSSELLGHYTVLRGELLRLDREESEALVAAHVPADAAQVAGMLADRTQGWCAAVVLAARAVAAAPDPVDHARRYADGGTTVADRVATEVFATLPERQRHLLLCVGAEPVVAPEVAAALTHDPEAGETLAELESMGLLVTRLPDVDGVRYAIHPLLAEVVRRRTATGGDDVRRAAATVRRAVRLDVAAGTTEHAFRRLVALGDHTAVAELLATVGPTLLLRGHGAGIGAWALAHPSAVDATPGAWFTIALERWLTEAVGDSRHWLDRILAAPLAVAEITTLQRAGARLMRSRLGLESVADAVADAERVLADRRPEPDEALVPVLLCQLAVSQNWLGRLDDAAASLTTVIQLGRSRDLPALVAVALSHLALTQFMLGREAGCVELTDELLASTEGQPWGTRLARARAVLVRELALLTDLPAADAGRSVDREDQEPLRAADPTTRFWARMHRARIELNAGSVSGAERALEVSIETPDLPDHLWAALQVEWAFLASLTGNRAPLGGLRDRLEERGFPGEAALVAGLRADLRGDRRGAAARFERAAAAARLLQPPVQALALVAAAQLRDELGEAATARDLMDRAVIATEVRRNAVPFLGWTRHGTAVAGLLDRQWRVHATPWVGELVATVAELPGVAAYFGPTPDAPEGELELAEATGAPVLSPRERDVLRELARGATYADIAAKLFVSENTVKTHVSSLYAKFSVNRRSDALAAARSLHLL